MKFKLSTKKYIYMQALKASAVVPSHSKFTFLPTQDGADQLLPLLPFTSCYWEVTPASCHASASARGTTPCCTQTWLKLCLWPQEPRHSLHRSFRVDGHSHGALEIPQVGDISRAGPLASSEGFPLKEGVGCFFTSGEAAFCTYHFISQKRAQQLDVTHLLWNHELVPCTRHPPQPFQVVFCQSTNSLVISGLNL